MILSILHHLQIFFKRFNKTIFFLLQSLLLKLFHTQINALLLQLLRQSHLSPFSLSLTEGHRHSNFLAIHVENVLLEQKVILLFVSKSRLSGAFDSPIVDTVPKIPLITW